MNRNKRLALVFALGFVMVFGLFCYVNAQTWFPANQATVAWDPVAPIATGDVIKYQCYTRNDTTSAGTKVGGEITATQQVISFPAEGRYYIGVETIRYAAGETVGIRSDRIAWSNNASDCSSAGPFGIVYLVSPGAVKNIRNVP